MQIPAGRVHADTLLHGRGSGIRAQRLGFRDLAPEMSTASGLWGLWFPKIGSLMLGVPITIRIILLQGLSSSIHGNDHIVYVELGPNKFCGSLSTHKYILHTHVG